MHVVVTHRADELRMVEAKLGADYLMLKSGVRLQIVMAT